MSSSTSTVMVMATLAAGVFWVAVQTGAAGSPHDAMLASADAASVNYPGVAVVELFTSEGCSSCPPADAVLAELVDQARDGKQHIFPLSFHVDYWNGLGWNDPFSSAQATQRQREYAATLEGDGVYTPQMIVNGQASFVGSRREEALRRVQQALARPAQVEVGIRLTPASTAEQVPVEVSAAGCPEGAVVHVALLERGLTTQVARGENAGRLLHHENVVRALRSVPVSGDTETPEHRQRMTVTLDARAVARRDRAGVVAWVQQGRTGAVLGAAETPLAVADASATH